MLTWNDGTTAIKAYGSDVKAFQATETQFKDHGLFNTNSQWITASVDNWAGQTDFVPEAWKQQFGEKNAALYVRELANVSSSPEQFNDLVDRVSVINGGGIQEVTWDLDIALAMAGAPAALKALLAKRVAATAGTTGGAAVDGAKAALDRIAQNPKGPDLTGKQPGTVLQAQSQKRIDDLAVQYNTKPIEPKDFQLNLGGKVLKTDPQVSKGAPVYIGATTSDMMSYFRQLTGVGNMPVAKVTPGKGTIYTAKTDAGARITLRDFSTSSQQTGASWTIDVMDKSINGGRMVEIKFK